MVPPSAASGLGKRHAVHLALGIAVLASRAAGIDRAPPTRGTTTRLKNVGGEGQHGPHGRADARSRASGSRGPGALELRSARAVATSRNLDARDERPGSGPHEHGDGGRPHRGLEDPLRSTTRGARSPSARATTTATTPPCGDLTWDSHQNTPSGLRLSVHAKHVQQAPASVPRQCFWAAIRPTSPSRAASPSKGSRGPSRAFSGRAGEAPTPRVYAGIHFRSACEDELALGRKVGQRAVTLYLQPARK